MGETLFERGTKSAAASEGARGLQKSRRLEHSLLNFTSPPPRSVSVGCGTSVQD